MGVLVFLTGLLWGHSTKHRKGKHFSKLKIHDFKAWKSHCSFLCFAKITTVLSISTEAESLQFLGAISFLGTELLCFHSWWPQPSCLGHHQSFFMDLSVVFRFVSFSLPEPKASDSKSPLWEGLWPCLCWLWWHQDSSQVSLREILSPWTQQDTADCGTWQQVRAARKKTLPENLQFLTEGCGTFM